MNQTLTTMKTRDSNASAAALTPNPTLVPNPPLEPQTSLHRSLLGSRPNRFSNDVDNRDSLKVLVWDF